MSNRQKMLPARGRMLIGGQLVESSGGNWIECINPANEECHPQGPARDPRRRGASGPRGEGASVAWAELSASDSAVSHGR